MILKYVGIIRIFSIFWYQNGGKKKKKNFKTAFWGLSRRVFEKFQDNESIGRGRIMGGTYVYILKIPYIYRGFGWKTYSEHALGIFP